MKSLLLLLLFLPLLAPAQTVHQQGYWGRAFLRTRLSERLTLHSEFDERRFAWPGGQWQFITHQHLHYRFSPTWDGALGGTLSWQPQGGVVVPERRIFEEATATLPLPGRLRLMPRLRVEQRWLRQLAGPDLTDEWLHKLRFRTRLQLDYHFTANWKIRASDELMLNTDSFDQNRLYAGAERQLGAGWAAELGYLFIYQRRGPNAGYNDRDVLRLTLFKDISLLAARQ
ncbi:DUF2490 domain-containing protein [Hymenobacter coccineus]|uniref:DUF2490 domain-containing protein n=1 Tax=Hymenobacter coccineus TaxID=1908235 RepID=A0A1G1TKB4_9BACT|nr:DUF2490 domain-containing protein [Hymenobacter coccineus]OGX91292.1 hypothetical protein BEN49_20375 [Hymenobacter coccineus]